MAIAGETLQLLPQRAVFWPRRRLLLVADIHFGKAASFRAQGIPVPHGTTSENLAVLDLLIATHGVEHILFLGDFLHAKAAHAPATLDAIRAWRSRHAALAMTLIRGNHDARAGDPPTDLMISVVDEPYGIDGFAFCHHPQRVAAAYVLAGHIHPVYRLAARGDALRLPCFVLGAESGLLPSFGAFTGGHPVTPADGERIYVVTADAVFAVPDKKNAA